MLGVGTLWHAVDVSAEVEVDEGNAEVEIWGEFGKMRKFRVEVEVPAQHVGELDSTCAIRVSGV